MDANNYRLRKNNNDYELNIPIDIQFDVLGREDLIQEYEDKVINKIINPVDDFEIVRFGHKPYVVPEDGDGPPVLSSLIFETKLQYEFLFFNRNQPIDTTTLISSYLWENNYHYTDNPNYSADTFSYNEILQYSNAFKRSFFKLDLYDTDDSETQQIYVTLILPTSQSDSEVMNIEELGGNTKIDIPKFSLDYVGNKEGFFIYWLRNPTYLNIDKFYMSAKFFNAKNGQFVRMINRPQSSLPRKHNFEKKSYYYFNVELDYNEHEYVIKFNNLRVGENEPIKWYEYVNP
jgi:hypothetical protein